MLYMDCDYNHGACPEILNKLAETNTTAYPGYGSDTICELAKEKIRKACGKPDAEIFFLVGGTQTNQIVIDTMLDSCEGVVAADSGHVSVHEAGAIEHSGHKVLNVPGHNGKMDAGELEQFLKTFAEDGNHDHMVFPGMVYISHPTEYGTLYSKEELTRLSQVCKEYRIPLYVDGARLAYGLAASATDVTMEELANLADIFYIGGTKVGALFGEAVVYTKNNMPQHFLTKVKQHGALLAKGWLLGLQFDTLFTDGLYERLGRNAIEMAERITELLGKRGYRMYLPQETNQLFLILENEHYAKLKEQLALSFWEAYDEGHTVVRLATSCFTTEEDYAALEKLL